MKRHNNLFSLVCSMDNLRLADALAQQEKGNRRDIIRHNKNSEANLLKLHYDLINKTLQPPIYTTFPVSDPKERLVFSSPYYPNLILDYAILNVIGPIIESTFTADTYACIKGRGVHKGGNAIKRALRNEANTKYCLKLDVRKFYPSIDHEVLKQMLRRKFKDNDLLWLMDLIIDAAPGLPIGRFLSQTLSNFYLTWFDHWIKEQVRVYKYFRYVDDIAILSSDKVFLHHVRREISQHLADRLKLEIKPNWRIFPVDICGIDMLGYKYYRKHTLMRKRIKQNFARAVAKNKSRSSIASYLGWAKHCNSKHLIKKLLPNEGFQTATN